MMKLTYSVIAAVLLLTVLGCASAPVANVEDYSTEPVLIQVQGLGIASTGNGLFESLDFLLLAGSNVKAERWVIEIVDAEGRSVRKAGANGAVPSSWTWNGEDASKRIASDGLYRARLSVWFPKATNPIVAETAQFLVDTQGPLGELRFSEGLFSPDGDGENDSLSIAVASKDALGSVDSWALDIYDAYGSVVKRFQSELGRDSTIVWDGIGANGSLVESASDYTVILTSRDKFGNTGVTKKEFSTDILVVKDGPNLRIRINSIIFKAYSPDYLFLESEQKESNLNVLNLLANKLKKFPGYRITLEGHAVSVFWENPTKAAVENRDVLMPLSLSRAQAIRDALIERGLDARSMSTIGIGASRPIVPFSDLQNRWKNRRVEFILSK